MNWLDLILLVVVLIGAVLGAKIGIIRAGLATVGVIIGTLLGGQLSGSIASLVSDIDSDSAIALVASYAVVITIALAAAGVAAMVLRKILDTLFLGWVDKFAGLALGIVAGAGISAAVIMGMAHWTYNDQVGGDITKMVLDSTIDVDQAKEGLENGLTNSKLAAIFIDTVDIIPASTMGFVPSNFRSALDVLESRRKIHSN